MILEKIWLGKGCCNDDNRCRHLDGIRGLTQRMVRYDGNRKATCLNLEKLRTMRDLEWLDRVYNTWEHWKSLHKGVKDYANAKVQGEVAIEGAQAKVGFDF